MNDFEEKKKAMIETIQNMDDCETEARFLYREKMQSIVKMVISKWCQHIVDMTPEQAKLFDSDYEKYSSDWVDKYVEIHT